ncbi:MAG: hypothetical protein ABI823_08735 [Bryobacteraceae bacterium]
MRKLLSLFLLPAAMLCAADYITGQAARIVIGQSTFTASDETTSDKTVGGAGGVAYANNTLFVADANRVGAGPINNRVLIFRNIGQQFPSATDQIAPSGMRCPLCGGQASTVLGQPDFTTTSINLTRTGMRLPTAVATDGTVLAVADTLNNRILIWNSIPASNGAPADIVLGQADFTTVRQPIVVDNKSVRAPQGLWIQNGRLYVADTQNHRVLIWNKIPTANYAPADMVLGQPNFNVAPEPDLTRVNLNAQANTMLNPVSVTSDGTRLFVTDLGHNRVLIWNSIPTQTQQAADVVVGQADFTTAIANDSSVLCESNGTVSSTDSTKTYPVRCAATLANPRFALSDGKRLYIADGGNDRVLVFNTIPTSNAVRADVILGQKDEFADDVTDNNSNIFNPNLGLFSPAQTRTPISLAWDGANLYVAEPYVRRVLVFTPSDTTLVNAKVRNAASREFFALGQVGFSGTVTKDDSVKITIGNGTTTKDYTYKFLTDDTLGTIVTKFVALINAGDGDPNVTARADLTFAQVDLIAKVGGEAGNGITLATVVTPATTTSTATIVVTPSGAFLSGAQSGQAIAPGSLITIFGDNLADQTVAAPDDATELPTKLGGVQVYIDGIRVPLKSVSPTEITAQVPFEVFDASSVSAYIRIERADGSVSVSNALAFPVPAQNPGIFAMTGDDPRPVIAVHGSSYATGLVSVDGTPIAGDVATVKIDDRSYGYTVQANDSLANIRDGLIALINSTEPKLIAIPAAQFTRIRLRARIPGPDGNNTAIAVSISDGAAVVLTATNPTLCCANVEDSLITEDNPAIPGETIKIYATGLGVVSPVEAQNAAITGQAYNGPAVNTANASVSSLAGGKSANVISAGLKTGAIGIYEVVLELNQSLPTNATTLLNISQDIYTSNSVTIPVQSPIPVAN